MHALDLFEIVLLQVTSLCELLKVLKQKIIRFDAFDIFSRGEFKPQHYILDSEKSCFNFSWLIRESKK